MIIYYTPGTCALSCIILAEWAEVPYRVCRVEREQRQWPVYKTIHSEGKVPALVTEDDRVLTETSAILLHIAYRDHQRRFVCKTDTPESDELHRWLSWLGSGFHAAFYPYFKPHLFVSNEELHDNVRRTAMRQIHKCLWTVDQHVRDRTSIMGDRFGMLDAYVYSMARWGSRIFEFGDEFPNLMPYVTKLQDDRGVKFARAIETGRIVDSEGGYFWGHVPLEARD